MRRGWLIVLSFVLPLGMMAVLVVVAGWLTSPRFFILVVPLAFLVAVESLDLVARLLSRLVGMSEPARACMRRSRRRPSWCARWRFASACRDTTRCRSSRSGRRLRVQRAVGPGRCARRGVSGGPRLRSLHAPLGSRGQGTILFDAHGGRLRLFSDDARGSARDAGDDLRARVQGGVAGIVEARRGWMDEGRDAAGYGRGRGDFSLGTAICAVAVARIPGIVAPGPVRTTILRMNCKTAGSCFASTHHRAQPRELRSHG